MNNCMGHMHNPWFLSKHVNWGDVFTDAPQMNFPKDKVLILQGYKINKVFYIKSGRIRFSVYNEHGAEKTIFILDKGNIFGEIASFNDKASPISAVTNTESTLQFLEINQFMNRTFSDVNYIKTLISDLSYTIEYLINHIKDISFYDSYKLVANYLYDLCANYGVETDKGIKINIIFTQQEMGELIGCSRVTVSKIMNCMKEMGIIDKIDSYVYVKDKRRLIDFSSI